PAAERSRLIASSRHGARTTSACRPHPRREDRVEGQGQQAHAPPDGARQPYRRLPDVRPGGEGRTRRYGRADTGPSSPNEVPMRFAFKTSPQDTTWADLLAVWREADQIERFESGWLFDHFY